jgi:APA family basic amino acid/polyamine antiporter
VPAVFARVHPRFRTPHWSTFICGLAVAALAGLFPISVLVQLVSVGTLIVFIAVALSVIVLRRSDPDRSRPFRTPWVPLIPILAMLVCAYLLTAIPLRTWLAYGIWLAIGLSIYLTYGRRPSVATATREAAL